MKQPTVLRELVPSDVAYLAGIIDGEGTIGIYKLGSHNAYHLRLVIVNTSRPVIDRIHERIGGAVVAYPATARARAHFQVVLWQERAADVIRRCRPHLIVKTAQAGVALDFMSGWVSYRGHGPVSEGELRRRHDLYERSLLLNGGRRSGRPKKRD